MSGPANRSVTGIALVVVLAAGALGVVLAATRSPIFDLDRHAVPKELALHLTALLGLILLLPRWRWLEVAVVEWLLGIYVGWSALSALFSENHWLAFRAWGISGSALVVFLMARAARRAGYGRWVLAALAVATTVGALGGLMQAYGADWALLHGERPPGGTLGNRNFLAHLSVIAVPIVGVLTLGSQRRWSWWTGIGALAALAGTIVLTRSRAAWLAAIVTLGLAALAAWWVRGLGDRHRRRTVGLALLGGTLAALVLPNRLAWRTGSPYRDSLVGLVNYQDGSGRGRLIQYRNTLRLVKQDPVFGTGPGNWMVQYPRVTTPGDPSFAGTDPIPTNPWPSSDWMAILAERGLIGVLLLAAAGVAATLVAVRRLRDPEQGAAALGILGLLCATLVTGMFDAVLLLAPPTLVVFAALGALLPDTGTVLTRELAGRRRAAAVGIPLLLTSLLVLHSGGQLAAIRITEIGQQRSAMEAALRYEPGNYRLHLLLSMRGNCAQRLPHARVARRLLPYHAWPKRMAATCE
ncbi:MAG TPA: O-antigen ligase family protein [Gemmatimonadales bacterium]